MKVFILLAMFTVNLANAQEYYCNTIRTGYNLLRAKNTVTAILSCEDEVCVSALKDKFEYHFCRALSHCDALASQLQEPCVGDEFKPAIRAEVDKQTKASIQRYMKESMEFVSAFKDMMGN